MITFLVQIVPLIIMIYKEYYSAKAQADADNKKFELDQAAIKAIVDAAVDQWNQANLGNSMGAANAWDKADQDGEKTEPAIDPTKKP